MDFKVLVRNGFVYTCLMYAKGIVHPFYFLKYDFTTRGGCVVGLGEVGLGLGLGEVVPALFFERKGRSNYESHFTLFPFLNLSVIRKSIYRSLEKKSLL